MMFSNEDRGALSVSSLHRRSSAGYERKTPKNKKYRIEQNFYCFFLCRSPSLPRRHSSWGYVVLSPHPTFSCALRRFGVSSERLQALLASVVMTTEHASRDLEKVVEVVLDRSRAT